jgi:hypothetical protein
MANRILYPLRHYDPEVKIVDVLIEPNGTGTPNIISGHRGVASVARSTLGDIVLTLNDGWVYMPVMGVSLQLATFADCTAMAGPYSSTAKTLHIFTATAGSQADISADGTNHQNLIHLHLACKDSSVK